MSKNFDLDLNFGEIFEDKVNKMLKCKGDIEVKTERDKWATTGNICIEIRYKGRPSGLSITEADTWIHLLAIDDEVVGGFIFPVKTVKVAVVVNAPSSFNFLYFACPSSVGNPSPIIQS